MGKVSTRAVTFSRCVIRTRPSSLCKAFYTHPRAHSARRQISQNSAHSTLAIANFSRWDRRIADRKSRRDLLRRRISFLNIKIVDWTARLTVASDLQSREIDVFHDESRIEDCWKLAFFGKRSRLEYLNIFIVSREKIRITHTSNNLYIRYKIILFYTVKNYFISIYTYGIKLFIRL